ncbi:MAG: radical SAM protein [Bacteriovoracaceae bacterium]|jgi:MoaA/NifB/PqqE/SkfB family radical SAM enzyme|nr:radical SAM protein [Bacteriovoracaceae bacterium]
MYKKFENEKITAKGDKRASVSLKKLETLWINTGTRCNLSCSNCYIESSPTNDRLSYISAHEVRNFLDEIENNQLGTQQIALTGGEPFINPDIIKIIDLILAKGYDLLILTNAYKVLERHMDNLLKINEVYTKKLNLRISLDHYTQKVHEEQRGQRTFDKTLEQIGQLVEKGFNISIAGRSLVDETIDDGLFGYKKLLKDHGIKFNLILGENMIIFPEMHKGEDVPEITTQCWDILSKSPDDMMCASQRMVVKKKGADLPTVLPCTLLAYDEQFSLGSTLMSSKKDVYLNHEFCAKFCVLGGASCSS